MGKSIEEFERALANLKSSKTEEEVQSNLTYIVKGFGTPFYREIVLSNPYYKDLFQDVRLDVIYDLEKLKETLREEISSIDSELKKENASSELKEIKGDCISLIIEIERKIEEIESIK